MTASLLLLALACSPAPPRDLTARSANRQYELQVTKNGELTLTKKGARAPRWKLQGRYSFGPYLVSDSGAWVAVLFHQGEAGSVQVQLYDVKGALAHELKLVSLLSEEERQFLSESMCGIDWLAGAKAEGDTLVLTFIQGGARRPTEEPGPTLRMHVDAKTGKVTRDAPVPRLSIREYVTAYGKAPSPRERHQAFTSLVLKARLSTSKGDSDLRAFFKERARAPADDFEGRLAMQSLGDVATASDLAEFATAPKGDDSDLEVYRSLQQRDPAAGKRYALEALKARRQPELLRQRALVDLVRDDMPEAREALALGLADSGVVRKVAVGQATQLKASKEGFELMLRLAVDEDAENADRARWALRQNYLERGPTPWHPAFRKAVEAGQLDAWGGALVIAGGMAEVAGDRAAAQRYYQKATQKLDAERPSKGNWSEAQLWAEARLRLAQVAFEQGKHAEARKLAEVVVAADCDEYVRAPAPNAYSGAPGSVGRRPGVVAKEILRTLPR